MPNININIGHVTDRLKEAFGRYTNSTLDRCSQLVGSLAEATDNYVVLYIIQKGQSLKLQKTKSVEVIVIYVNTGHMPAVLVSQFLPKAVGLQKIYLLMPKTQTKTNVRLFTQVLICSGQM